MEMIISNDQESFDYQAAMQIVNLVKEKPNAVIGLATGNTPKGMYEVLVKMFENNEVDFSNTITLNLDEYLGVEQENKGTCKSYLTERFYSKVNLQPKNMYHLNSNPSNKDGECKRYNNLINEIGGIDLVILGIGNNGHLGFNEPKTAFETTVHVCPLTDVTRTANIWSFGSKDKVPTEGITMGIKNIMNAKKLLMLANTKKKSEIVKKAFKGAVTDEVPASVLQLHNNVVVILDKEAAELI